MEEALRLHRSAISAAPERDDLLLLAGRSANRRTLFPFAVGLAFATGFIGGSLVGGMMLAWLMGAAVTWVDGRLVRSGRRPLLMARRLAAQPGLGAAAVAYRRERFLRRRHVGPVVGTGHRLYLAGTVLPVLMGLFAFTAHVAAGAACLIVATVPGVAGWTRWSRSRWLDAG